MTTPLFRSIRPVLTLAAAAALTAAASAQTPTLRVALCGAAGSSGSCQWTSVQSALLATNRFATVDIIDVTAAGGGTPTLQQLLAYDALLCWTNTTPADTNAWGTVLADYVDAGGGVVVAVFANSTTTANRNIGGRWQNGYEVVLDQGGNTSGAGGALGTVAIPSHPVMAGVTSFTGGTLGTRPTSTALEVGSVLVASWNDGKVLVAQGANPRRVDLGFYPPIATCSQSGWATGGDQLMANALEFVGGGAVFAPYGAGCAGALGVPVLDAAPGSRPILGTTYQLEVRNAPVGVAFVVMGFSNTMSGPVPLPLDLGAVGMPGCSLLTNALAVQFAAGGATTATWSLTLPNTASLQGTVFYNQGFPIDGGANVAGLTASNGGYSRVGS